MHVGKIEPIEYVPGGQGVQDRDPAREVDPIGQEVQFIDVDDVQEPSDEERVREILGPYDPAGQYHIFFKRGDGIIGDAKGTGRGRDSVVTSMDETDQL